MNTATASWPHRPAPRHRAQGGLARAAGATVLAALALALGAAPSPAAAQTRPAPPPGPEHLRIVGGLAGISQFTRHEQPFWAEQLARVSGGRVTAEIAAFDRAGIRGQEMLRLVQLGVVPFGTLSLGLSSTVDPLLNAPDLAGLNPDFESLRNSVRAFRPYLATTLRSRYGAELLAVYTYPAQVTFCRQPLRQLADLAGRRVRTTSPTQADLVEALGGIPVQTGFAEIVPNMKAGNLDCVITGTMSGNTIGLHQVTSHIHPMAITWGLSVFVANTHAWNGLSAATRELLLSELPKLEHAIWADAQRETGEGLACNTGAAGCEPARRGSMTEVKPSAADDTRRREVLADTVLKRWGQRCGTACVGVWNDTIGAAVGVRAK